MSNKKLVSTLNTIERSMRRVLMESANDQYNVSEIQSPMLKNYIMSDLLRFCDLVKTPEGAKLYIVKAQYREWINKSNRWKDEVRNGVSNGNELVDRENGRQKDMIKNKIAPLVPYKITKEEAARIDKNRGNNPPVIKSKAKPAPIAAPKPQTIKDVKMDPVQEKKDAEKSVKIMDKTVSTGNTAVNAYNESGVNSQAFKATCRAFGLSLIALGIYLGYKMYPNAKEQFIQAWDNGNPNKERLIALLKGVGACLLVVGIIGCGIYLTMYSFKSESIENDNSFMYNILNASANVVNGIAEYF